MTVALNPDALLYDARKAMLMGMLWRLERGQCVNCERPTPGLTCIRMGCAIAFEWLTDDEQGMLWRFWQETPRQEQGQSGRRAHPWRLVVSGLRLVAVVAVGLLACGTPGLLLARGGR